MTRIALVGLVAIVAAMAAAVSSAQAADTAQKDGRVFELRTYTAAPGKLDELNKRFRDHTCKLFKKHGIEVIGFWTPAEGEEANSTLIYIVAFPSREAQKKAWEAFRADPEWNAAKKQSEVGGPLTAPQGVKSLNINATDYSPIR